MTESFVAEAHGATAGAVSLTIPAGVQGQDVMLIFAAASTTAILTPAGWSVVDTQSPATGTTCVLLKKIAAGSAGSASSDVGTSVSVAPVTSGIHTSAALVAWRDVDPANPINAEDFQGYAGIAGGTTTFTGPVVPTTVDGCNIISALMDKNSLTSINFTQPSGYTARSSAVASSGTGKTDTVVASQTGGSHGNWGGDTWNTDATPGTVGIFTVALTPISTTQTVRPTSDVSSSSATGVPNAGSLYANIDENGSPDPSDYVELLASGNFEVGLATLTDPGVDTGFTVDYTVAFGTSTAGAVWAVSLYQSTTLIETWNHTQSSDNDTQSHALSSTNIANVVFSGSPAVASDLRLKFVLTSVS